MSYPQGMNFCVDWVDRLFCMNMTREVTVICFVVGLFFALPNVAVAAVEISEIAWMGTAASVNDEWIELHNTGSEAVELNGWELSWATTASSPKVVELSGSVVAEGHYLLERTDDESVPGVSADLIYVGALGNGGELLVLKNANGEEVDRVDGLDGWKINSEPTKGDNTTKETAQKFDGGWVTAPGTPRAVNVAPPSSGGAEVDSDNLFLGGDNEEAEGVDTGDEIAGTGAETTGSTSSGSSFGGGAVSAHDSPVSLSVVSASVPVIRASAGRARIASPRSPVRFTAAAYDGANKPLQGSVEYLWSFGDGAKAHGKESAHSYRFPGEYNVVLQVRAGELEAVARTTVTVTLPRVRVVAAEIGIQGSFIELLNEGKQELNLAGWELRSGRHKFALPGNTIIGAGKRLKFPYANTSLAIGRERLALAYPDGVEVSGSAFTPPVLDAEASSAPSVSPVSTSIISPPENGVMFISDAVASKEDRTQIQTRNRELATTLNTTVGLSLESQLATMRVEAGRLLLATGVLALAQSAKEKQELSAPTPPQPSPLAGEGAYNLAVGGENTHSVTDGVSAPAPAPEPFFNPQALASVGREDDTIVVGDGPTLASRRVVTPQKSPGFFAGVKSFLARLFE